MIFKRVIFYHFCSTLLREQPTATDFFTSLSMAVGLIFINRE